MNLSTCLGKIKLKNPIITASGTFGNGKELSKIVDINKLGAVTTKSITLKETKGNLPPRICETPSGIINTIGLQNRGLENFLNEDAPFLKQFDTVIIANVAGCNESEYIEVCRLLDKNKAADILEINISCPNVEKGGMAFGNDPDAAAKLIAGIKKTTKLPVFAKLTPNACNVTEVAKAVELAGADGFSLINTILAMAIDPKTLRSKISKDFGGLSGPAIKPIALRMVYEVASNSSLPVIGIGGVTNGSDVIEFLAAGAKAVAIGTETLVNPDAAEVIIKELEKCLKGSKTDSVEKLIGSYKGA